MNVKQLNYIILFMSISDDSRKCETHNLRFRIKNCTHALYITLLIIRDIPQLYAINGIANINTFFNMANEEVLHRRFSIPVKENVYTCTRKGKKKLSYQYKWCHMSLDYLNVGQSFPGVCTLNIKLFTCM